MKQLLTAMGEAGWKDGASVTKLAMAICAIKVMSQEEKQLLEQSLAGIDMPRHTRCVRVCGHALGCEASVCVKSVSPSLCAFLSDLSPSALPRWPCGSCLVLTAARRWLI